MVIDDIILSKSAPKNRNCMWLNVTDNKAELKAFYNDDWNIVGVETESWPTGPTIQLDLSSSLAFGRGIGLLWEQAREELNLKDPSEYETEEDYKAAWEIYSNYLKNLNYDLGDYGMAAMVKSPMEGRTSEIIFKTQDENYILMFNNGTPVVVPKDMPEWIRYVVRNYPNGVGTEVDIIDTKKEDQLNSLLTFQELITLHLKTTILFDISSNSLPFSSGVTCGESFWHLYWMSKDELGKYNIIKQLLSSSESSEPELDVDPGKIRIDPTMQNVTPKTTLMSESGGSEAGGQEASFGISYGNKNPVSVWIKRGWDTNDEVVFYFMTIYEDGSVSIDSTPKYSDYKAPVESPS